MLQTQWGGARTAHRGGGLSRKVKGQHGEQQRDIGGYDGPVGHTAERVVVCALHVLSVPYGGRGFVTESHGYM